MDEKRQDEKIQISDPTKRKKMAFFIGLFLGIVIGALIMFIENSVVVSNV